MEKKTIVPNERECISRCIMKYWSSSAKKVKNRDQAYERCLTDCDVCGSA